MILCTENVYGKLKSRSSVYSKIFSLDGGIFDWFTTELIEGYDNLVHNIAYVKEAFINILRVSAFQMFEKKGTCQLTLEEYQNIISSNLEKTGCDSCGAPVWRDFPIDNLYETGSNIEFVHRSIYEYFVAEYLFSRIKKICKSSSVLNFLNRDIYYKAAEELSEIFKTGTLTNEICGYLQYMVEKEAHLNVEMAVFFKKVFAVMLLNGMTCYLQKTYVRDVLEMEMNIFQNMVRLIRLWKEQRGQNRRISFSEMEKHNLETYVVLCCHYKKQLDLRFFDLSYMDLRGVDLRNVNLSNVNLQYADLSRADLEHVNLVGADLRGACFNNMYLNYTNLRAANLERVNLRGNKLYKSNLQNANLQRANLREADLRSANMKNAILKSASLQGAKLYNTTFTNAVLKGANLSCAKYTIELDDAII